ncbi:hypothetical protein [Rhizobium alvei]|uniref:Uncharacterized protein n=1 Tax=Rhizobium alvei TaxID=1132659 RepID=A0ABT8YKM5_9HYPH|nr:hypothetical protein [Rhizobium alvei]MDO6963805.1 hypothetical protein [Rhizobium alvei]
MAESCGNMRAWADLVEAERIALQIAYQPELDRQSPTCSMDIKIERFAGWLRERGILFVPGDLGR